MSSSAFEQTINTQRSEQGIMTVHAQDAIGVEGIPNVQQSSQRDQLRRQLSAPVGGVRQDVLCTQEDAKWSKQH